MDVLALTDVHGNRRVIDRVRMLLAKRSFDAVFLMGDLNNDGSVSFAQEFVEPFDRLYAVPGNMDNPPIVEFLEKGGYSIHNRVKRLGGWKIAGFGGNNLPDTMPFAHSEEEIGGSLRKLKIDRKTILLTHMPPRGCFDMVDGENIGSLAIREVIEGKKPFMNICGHIHEHEGEQVIGNTIVVSVGAAKDMRAAIMSINRREVDVDFINL
ncbi:MAG: metallophosphoesterase family protein [Candidatus Micrarchaeota archaeon]